MQYRSLDQIADDADIRSLGAPCLSRRQRLERWAEVLERRHEPLRTIPDMEYGPREQRALRRADHSLLTVAYEDPLLRAAGLRSDRVGDAAEFFGLSHWRLHVLTCACHHGRTIESWTAAAEIRALARPISTTRLAVGTAIAAGLAALVLF